MEMMALRERVQKLEAQVVRLEKTAKAQIVVNAGLTELTKVIMKQVEHLTALVEGPEANELDDGS